MTNKHAQKLGRAGGLKHDGLKTRDTLLKKYGINYYKEIAIAREKAKREKKHLTT